MNIYCFKFSSFCLTVWLRLPLQAFVDAQKNPEYLNMRTTAQYLIQSGGLFSLWSGLAPRLFRLCSAFIILQIARTKLIDLVEDSRTKNLQVLSWVCIIAWASDIYILSVSWLQDICIRCHTCFNDCIGSCDLRCIIKEDTSWLHTEIHELEIFVNRYKESCLQLCRNN